MVPVFHCVFVPWRRNQLIMNKKFHTKKESTIEAGLTKLKQPQRLRLAAALLDMRDLEKCLVEINQSIESTLGT